MQTRTAPIDQIEVPSGRQRTTVDEGHIAGLFESIFSETGPGLVNPITLRDGKTLVAGECRLRTIKLGYSMGKTLRHAGQPVPEGQVPYIDFGDLDELAREEAEYVENAVRQDLHWKDAVQAKAKLHALRTKQKAAKGEIQTVADTAREVYKAEGGTYSDNISTAVRLAAMMDDKEIASASSFKEAKKILAKKDEKEHRERLAAVTGKVSITDKMKCYQANCLDWMKEQPDGQFDVVLTDPPYGMGADEFGDAAGRMAGTGHDYTDGEAPTKALLSACIPEFYRLSKPEAHLYLWCDIDLFPWLREQCRAAGYRTFRTPLINIKPEGGRVPWPKWGPRRCYEICLYAVKGDKPVTAILPDVFESRLVEGNFGHGAQKPVEAYVNLLKRSVRPGDRVLDAFAGTGTIFPAAQAVGCFAVGVEQEAAAYGTCVKRIGELV